MLKCKYCDNWLSKMTKKSRRCSNYLQIPYNIDLVELLQFTLHSFT